jgi:MFS family permease
VPSLWRNRDFVLLQAGQLLSSVGSQASSLAFPLLTLSVTHSPSKAGVVGFASLVPAVLLSPIAGVAVDHWNRKAVMIVTDVVHMAIFGLLAASIYWDDATFWLIVVVAIVDGSANTFFSIAQVASLRSVVPTRQLPDAAGIVEARRAGVRLAAPPLGGALFQIARGLPFLVNAVSYLASTAAILAVRSPFQQPREADTARIRERLAEGFHFLWNNRFIRTTAFVYGLGNVLATGIFLVVVVVGRRQGLTGGEIGLLFSLLGAATLLGSVASPLHRRYLGVRTILLLELWTWAGMWVFVVWPSVWSLLAVVVPFGLCAPVTDSVVVGYMTAMTPDRLLGRVESVRLTIALTAAPFGPLLAGYLLDTLSSREAVAIFAVIGLVLALWGTLSPAIRAAPSLDEIVSEPVRVP